MRRSVRVRGYNRRDGKKVSSYMSRREFGGRRDVTPGFDMSRCIAVIGRNAGVKSAGAVCQAMYEKWKMGVIKKNPFSQRRYG